MQKTKKQDFTPDTLDNVTPEPTVDTATDGGESIDESFQEELVSDKMSAKEAEPQNDWQDKYVRLAAEFDNYRKRTAREKIDLIQSGGAQVLKLMLATADDFDRALQHIVDPTDRQGVELVYTKFLAALATQGVEAMDLVGKPFDVDLAEAIARMPCSDEFAAGTVCDVAEKGYMIKDRVLRFAKVVVAQ
ncbi:MAG: nucleotide exchange factor GrpE [Mucinivorans sp.]